MRYLFTLLLLCAIAAAANAATINAASASEEDFEGAYFLSSPGDTIVIPPGTNLWTALFPLRKINLTVRGSGTDKTRIRKGSGDGGFLAESNNIHITGITWDREVGSSSGPCIRVGSGSGCPTILVQGFRISSNAFLNIGPAIGDVTGNHAISVEGYCYGFIDYNLFDRCPGEIINTCADGVAGLARNQDFGGYENGTVIIERNTFNMGHGARYENPVDGNSAQRVAFRWNTLNISNGTELASAVVSGHETCARCTGVEACGDAGTVSIENYGNTVNLHATGQMRDWTAARAGKNITYSNNVTFTGSSSGRHHVGMWISNYRSTVGYLGCANATHARGYSEKSHEFDSGFIAEGLEVGKSTLNGAINSSVTTLTLASASGFNANGNANGYAIRIGGSNGEVIYYSGVSGNQLTGLTRGASTSTAASHADGASVDYLIFGRCLEQPNNTYIFGNMINGVVGAAMNDVLVCGQDNDCATAVGDPDYTAEDIKSKAERPALWAYAQESFSYTIAASITGGQGGGGGGGLPAKTGPGRGKSKGASGRFRSE